jgi:hypothetical protein
MEGSAHPSRSLYGLVNEHDPLTRSACSRARLDAAIDDHALSVGRFLDGAISPRPSASLMAARVLALPMLARSAMCANGKVHFQLPGLHHG